MAFRRKKQESRDAAQDRAPAPQPATSDEYQAQPAPLGSGLERKWEEAWNRARSGRR